MLESLLTGMAGYLRGARWMLSHPFLLILSIFPFLAGIIGLVAGVMAFIRFGNSWMTNMMMVWFSGWSEQWYWLTFYWLVKGLLLISVFMLCIVSALAIMAAFASPVNEYISLCVERELLGEVPQSISWKRIPKVMIGEFCKVLVIVIVPFMMMLIPGINFFAGITAAFLIGWDFYDYPLARRGWGFRARFKFVVSEFFTILGFGLWLVIPLVHIFLIPLAVAGGTILNVEALAKKGFVTLKVTKPNET